MPSRSARRRAGSSKPRRSGDSGSTRSRPFWSNSNARLRPRARRAREVRPMRNDEETVLVVRRRLPVPREKVFAAWLDPASLAQWMRPGETTGATAEVDPRVGGKFRIVMHQLTAVEHWGEYLAIEPPSLLSFTWHSEHTDRQPTVVTVELHERGDATELILTHRRLPAAQIDGHRRGWSDIVHKLDAALTAGPSPD